LPLYPFYFGSSGFCVPSFFKNVDMIIFFQAYFSGRRLEHLKFPAFLGEVNPESIYDAQMFNKKSNDFK